jgi:hypothetical protein
MSACPGNSRHPCGFDHSPLCDRAPQTAASPEEYGMTTVQHFIAGRARFTGGLHCRDL